MNTDYSILEIIKSILILDQNIQPGVLSIFNQSVKTQELGFDGYPISKVFQSHYLSDVSHAIQLVKTSGLTKWKKYTKEEIVMDSTDCVPNTYNVNQLQNVIDKLKENRFLNECFCLLHNPVEDEMLQRTYAVEFYVRPAEQDKEKLRDKTDILDIRFIQNKCNILDELNDSILVFSIIQKVVALCTGLLPGKVYGSIGNCYIREEQIDEAKSMFNKYRSVYYKVEPDLFKDGLTQIKINNNLMNKWRSQIPEVLPTLNDFNYDGTDFEINTNL